MARFFSPNSPPVVHETVSSETIVVDLESGAYFHLDPVGSYVWELLMSGRDTDTTAAAVAAHFGIDGAVASAAVDGLCTQLVAENLVSATDVAAQTPAEPEGPAGEYAEPVLSKYDDMQELLVLDPVHEVDDTGWPARR